MAEAEDLFGRLQSEWDELVRTVTVRSEPGVLALPLERREPMSRVALVALLEEVKADWEGIRVRLRTEDVTRYVNAGWTLADLLAHMASWATEFRREVETVYRGGTFDYTIPYVMTVMGPTRWNEEQVRARRGRGLEAIFEEFESETTRLQEIVVVMPEPQLYGPASFPLSPTGDPDAMWKVPSAVIIAGKCIHDRHHFGQIRKKLDAWRE